MPNDPMKQAGLEQAGRRMYYVRHIRLSSVKRVAHTYSGQGGVRTYMHARIEMLLARPSCSDPSGFSVGKKEH